MAKTLTAQDVVSVNPMTFIWREGEVVGLEVRCEVNYGEVGLTHTIDIWDDLTDDQKDKVRDIYERAREIVEGRYLE